MAFWLLPFIPKRGAILLDTWAIGSVAYRAMQLSGVDLAVDAIDQHPNHDRGTLRPYLEEFTARHLHEGELLMLSSLSDTGETIRSIAKILGQVLDFQDGFPRDDIAIVVLVATSTESMPSGT
jgi:hypothetical protein